MKRIYEQVILKHFDEDEMMLFLAGPRQSGKTTCSEMAAKHYKRSLYLNWDEREHSQTILEGSSKIAELAQLDQLQQEKVCIIFDELHKYTRWKNFLKGFYDVYKDRVHIIVTGSSRLDIFKRGGDSLMGRYFLYRMHPLSVAECINLHNFSEITQPPKEINNDAYENLYHFGGYPKPFLRHDKTFFNRWQRLRSDQLVKEDIRDGTRIHELSQLAMLVEIIKLQGAKQLNFSKLAKKISVSIDTIRRWIQVLSSFYYCFTIKPWHKNISRSLIKEPKIYLWDWSLLHDEGEKFENFIASHLLKATHFWTDMGYGNFDLFYLRTLDKAEVDFVITKDKEPWFIVEAKYSSQHSLNPTLIEMHKQLNTKHAFQVCHDLDYIEKDCFKETNPIKVPAKTFLSQLI